MSSNLLHRRRPCGDDGAMLLLVLLFVMVVGLALGALIPYTQVGIREAGTARDVRSTQNAVDGATQGAIAQVREDIEQGNERSGRCDDYTAAAYPPPVGTSNVNVTVTCQNALGSSGSAADIPPYAIVTTMSAMDVSGGHPLGVDGGLYISGNINTTGSSNSAVVVVGDAYSTTKTCGNVTGTGKICPTSGIPAMPAIEFPSTLGVDAASAQVTIDGLVKDPAGTCTSKFSIVTFQPGYYSEPPAPGSSCTALSNTSSTWWFSPCKPYPTCVATATSPGIYYFDFADTRYNNYSDESLLNLDALGVNLVGGSLISTYDSSTTETVLLAAAAAGHRCDQDKTGAQIVLGGASRMSTGIHSEIELCASQTSATSPQRIAIYGLSQTHGTLSPTGPRTVSNTAPNVGSATTTAATTSPSDQAFRDLVDSADNPDGARAVSDFPNVSVGKFSGSGGTKYGARLTDFPSVTEGALIPHVYVDVTHLESDSHLAPTLKVTYSDGGSDTCDVAIALKAVPATLLLTDLVKTRVDLMDSSKCSTYFRSHAYRWRLLNPDSATPVNKLKVDYEVAGGSSVAAGSKAIVDGVQLEVEAVKPAPEAERCVSVTAGCVIDAYSNSGSTATNNTYFIGTVYSPDATINVVVHNSPNTIFQRGVVVGGITIVANASSTQTDPPFQLPHSAVRNRTVLFTATSDTRVRLRALVHFIDCLPAPACENTPNAVGNLVWPGKVVQIKSWTTLQ